MKLLPVVLTCAVIAGCASNRPPASASVPNTANQAMPYAQLERINVANFNCANIDQVVSNMERNLRLKGLQNANPEDLSEENRLYNARARIVIWSMRIGCSNPDRYKK